MQRNYLVDLVAGQINIYWMVKMAYPRYVSGYPPPDAISGAVGCRQHIPKNTGDLRQQSGDDDSANRLIPGYSVLFIMNRYVVERPMNGLQATSRPAGRTDF